jgi:hypothetical protein
LLSREPSFGGRFRKFFFGGGFLKNRRADQVVASGADVALVAGWTELASFAGEGEKAPIAAVGALDAGKKSRPGATIFHPS